MQVNVNYKLQNNKYTRHKVLRYIHTCRSYVNTPRELNRHAVESPTGTLIVLLLADSSDFGLLGEQSAPKLGIPCLRRRITAIQNSMPLDLSSVEKSVTIQTNKQTKNNKRYIHILPIGMCG